MTVQTINGFPWNSMHVLRLLFIVPMVVESIQIPMEISSNRRLSVNFNLMNGAVLKMNVSTLRVSAVQYEPFLYQNENGEFLKGIEYEIVETIAKQLNMSLSYQYWYGHPWNYNQLYFK